MRLRRPRSAERRRTTTSSHCGPVPGPQPFSGAQGRLGRASATYVPVRGRAGLRSHAVRGFQTPHFAGVSPPPATARHPREWPIGLGIVVLLLVAITTACDSHDSGSLFGYDDDAPLSVRTVDLWQDGNLRVSSVSYASPRGGRVPALIVAPRGNGPFAGLIVQHGLPGDKFRVLGIAEDFARTGAVVVAIDASWSRRKELPDFTERDRADQVQLMVDLRHAVDLLRSRDDVNDNRIAYVGVSYGAAMGGLLAGTRTASRHSCWLRGTGASSRTSPAPRVRGWAVVTASSRTPQAQAGSDEANRTDQVDRPRRRAHPVPVGPERRTRSARRRAQVPAGCPQTEGRALVRLRPHPPARSGVRRGTLARGKIGIVAAKYPACA